MSTDLFQIVLQILGVDLVWIWVSTVVLGEASLRETSMPHVKFHFCNVGLRPIILISGISEALRQFVRSNTER